KAVVRDTREWTTWRIDEKHFVYDYDITTGSLTGKTLKLTADPHHAGFHFRAAEEVAEVKTEDKNGGGAKYVRPEGAALIKDDNWSGCAWVHCTFSVNGRPYAVTHMDAPENPKPTTYSTR